MKMTKLISPSLELSKCSVINFDKFPENHVPPNFNFINLVHFNLPNFDQNTRFNLAYIISLYGTAPNDVVGNIISTHFFKYLVYLFTIPFLHSCWTKIPCKRITLD